MRRWKRLVESFFSHQARVRKVNSFATHAPFLEAALRWSRRKMSRDQSMVIFEVGTGGESSRIFTREIVSNIRAELRGFENSQVWIDDYITKHGQHPRRLLIEIKSEDDWRRQVLENVNALSDSDFLVAFIDSSPWKSRADSLDVLKSRADIVLVHDVDYFPSNAIFGEEVEPISVPEDPSVNPTRLEPAKLGRREYSDVFHWWLELFPLEAGYFTGPPTLVGSNRHTLEGFKIPRGSIRQGCSDGTPPQIY